MKASKPLIYAIAALGVLVAVFAVVKVYQTVYDRKVPNFKGKTQLYVYPWTEQEEVFQTLVASGNVKKASSLERVFKDMGEMQVGHYQIDSTCSSIYVARMLHKGWQTPVNLTITGIRTHGALARKIGSQMLADSTAVADFIASEDSTGVKPAMLFTKIIPDTYQILWTSSVREIFDRLFKERDAWWTPERKAAAKKQGLTLDEVSILASIVDGESKYAPELPSIAAVYLNRLKTGMYLQACPTVAFVYDYKLNRILTAHTKVDSPYNTYRNMGLPPGPISCPPKNCLEAVLYPDSNSYIFFCADPSFNGRHRFASTYAQHLVNAKAFQKALDQRNREKAAAGK